LSRRAPATIRRTVAIRSKGEEKVPNSKMLSRRGILLTGAIATAGALLARGASAATGQTQLSPDDPQAMALGYYEDASEVDTAAWPKKAGTDQN